jgi:hypothetical protein
MNRLSRAISAGVLGSLTTNVLHEIVRRMVPDAPRVDLLGMQGLAKGAKALGVPVPTGRRLYFITLAADLISNSAYFALAAIPPRRFVRASGWALGICAGIGAVVLPRPLDLAAETTARTALTRVLTCTLYTAGGVVSGLAARSSNS